MKKQNYERLYDRPLQSGRVMALVLAMLVAGIFTGTVQAEAGTGTFAPQQPEFPDSQPLDAVPIRVADDGVIVRNGNVVLSGEERNTSLAMVELPDMAVPTNILVVESRQVEADRGQEAGANGEDTKFPYALMLTLLALISLVPVSRRH